MLFFVLIIPWLVVWNFREYRWVGSGYMICVAGRTDFWEEGRLVLVRAEGREEREEWLGHFVLGSKKKSVWERMWNEKFKDLIMFRYGDLGFGEGKEWFMTLNWFALVMSFGGFRFEHFRRARMVSESIFFDFIIESTTLFSHSLPPFFSLLVTGLD